MKIVVICLVLAGLLRCQPDDKFTGVAAGAKGRYLVTTYIVSGDTLFSLLPGSTGYEQKVNKVGVDNFSLVIEVVDSDQLMIRTDWWRNGLRSTSSKEVAVRLTSYNYEFSLLNPNAASAYEGNVGRFSGIFYERTVGGVLLYPTGSATNSSPPSSQDVVIIAQPAK